MKTQFVTVNEISKVLGISRSKAYQIVRDMNNELKNEGYITVAGKCPAKFLERKFYGFELDEIKNSEKDQSVKDQSVKDD